MIWSWRKRRAARRAAASKKQLTLSEYSGGGDGRLDLIIPDQFLCPISHDLMKDPVTLSTGMTYDRASIETWMDAGNSTCPVTNQVLLNPEAVPNHAIRKMIQDWCVKNTSRGIERIPTPRIPIASHEVSEILSKIEAAVQQNDDEKCKELVLTIKASAKESDRNKRCIAMNGAGRVLSEAFDSFARRGMSYDAVKHGDMSEEILSALMVIMPRLDEEINQSLSSVPSLQRITWIMRFGSLSSRRNAVLALKSVLSLDETKTDDIVKMEGALECLVRMIKEPICPTTTKASLLAMYHMLNPSEPPTIFEKAIATSLTEMGLIPLLLDMLVDSERSVCEKALGVLDCLCSCDEGRLQMYENALTVPVLVKKLLRVSDLATELSISTLSKLGKHDENGETGVMIEALQVGAFHKLLLVLQIGTREVTREKVMELLKMLNLYRSRVECIDSLDFKDLKRPF